MSEYREALQRFNAEWQAGRQPVTISRASHEALMAAAKALKMVSDDALVSRSWKAVNEALAALSAHETKSKSDE